MTFGCCLLTAGIATVTATVAERRHLASMVTAGQAVAGKLTGGLLAAAAGAGLAWLLG